MPCKWLYSAECPNVHENLCIRKISPFMGENKCQILRIYQSCRCSVLLNISQNRPANAGGSPLIFRWEISPKAETRKYAMPSRRSSVQTVVTEVGAAMKPCQSTIGDMPRRCPSMTHSTPKWQKIAIVLSLGRTAL